MKNRTFLIDNENFSSFEERLYGYTVSDTGDILVDELPERPGDTGLFVMVTKEDGDLRIAKIIAETYGLNLNSDNALKEVESDFEQPLTADLAYSSCLHTSSGSSNLVIFFESTFANIQSRVFLDTCFRHVDWKSGSDHWFTNWKRININ